MSDEEFRPEPALPQVTIELKSRTGCSLTVSWDMDAEALAELHMLRRRSTGKIRSAVYQLEIRPHIEQPKDAKYFYQSRWR